MRISKEAKAYASAVAFPNVLLAADLHPELIACGVEDARVVVLEAFQAGMNFAERRARELERMAAPKNGARKANAAALAGTEDEPLPL